MFTVTLLNEFVVLISAYVLFYVFTERHEYIVSLIIESK